MQLAHCHVRSTRMGWLAIWPTSRSFFGIRHCDGVCNLSYPPQAGA
jgi:hypothetical protein